MSATPTPDQLREAADALDAETWAHIGVSQRLRDALHALRFFTGIGGMVDIAATRGNKALYDAVALTLRLEAQRIEELAEHPLAANREVICDECDGMIAKIVRDSWEAKP